MAAHRVYDGVPSLCPQRVRRAADGQMAASFSSSDPVRRVSSCLRPVVFFTSMQLAQNAYPS